MLKENIASIEKRYYINYTERLVLIEELSVTQQINNIKGLLEKEKEMAAIKVKEKFERARNNTEKRIEKEKLRLNELLKKYPQEFTKL